MLLLSIEFSVRLKCWALSLVGWECWMLLLNISEVVMVDSLFGGTCVLGLEFLPNTTPDTTMHDPVSPERTRRDNLRETKSWATALGSARNWILRVSHWQAGRNGRGATAATRRHLRPTCGSRSLSERLVVSRPPLACGAFLMERCSKTS